MLKFYASQNRCTKRQPGKVIMTCQPPAILCKIARFWIRSL